MSGLSKYFLFVVFAVITFKILDFIFGGDSLSTGSLIFVVGAAIVFALDKNRGEGEYKGVEKESFLDTLSVLIPPISRLVLGAFLVVPIAIILIELKISVIWSILIAIYLVRAGFLVKEKGFYKFLEEDTGIGNIKKITWVGWLILGSFFLILGIFIYLNYAGEI